MKVFDKAGDLDRLRCIRRGDKPATVGLPGVEYTGPTSHVLDSEFNLVAGTTWLFSSKDMKHAPVDVLIVDEAGQLALADALAASRSAQNLILLGDPLQLPQVSQASHPGGGGRSVLEHVLGDAVTMPADRGVFLTRDPAHAPRMSLGSFRSRSTRDVSSATRAVRTEHRVRYRPAVARGRPC